MLSISHDCLYRYKDLAAVNGEVGEAALALYCATVRATLFVCKGYECQEKEGVFMTAFPGPIKALEWAVTLQMALLRSATSSRALILLTIIDSDQCCLYLSCLTPMLLRHLLSCQLSLCCVKSCLSATKPHSSVRVVHAMIWAFGQMCHCMPM